MTGWAAKGTPAVAVGEGWVWITSLLAAPATSRSVPKFELVEAPTRLAVPDSLRLPVANGVPAVGWTRTFCQVSEQVTPLILLLVTVKTNCVVVTEVIGTDVPLETVLMLFPELPLP